MSKIVDIAKQAARLLVQLEIVLLSFVYFYFVLTDQLPLFAIALIALIWLARKWATGRFTHHAPRITLGLQIPILAMLAWLPVSLAVSVNWFASLPKVYGVVLGAAFFFAIANQIQTRDDLARAAFWLVLACLGIAVAGLIGTDWAQERIGAMGFVYERLPRIVQGIPRSIAGGFARNGVGGTLALTIQLLAAMAFACVGARHSPEQDSSKSKVGINQSRFPKTLMWRMPRPYVVAAALAVSLLTLALTQSRGGILGTAVGLLGVAIWRERRFAWTLVIGAFALAGFIAAGYGDALLNFVLRMDAQSGTLASRLEVWQRGLMMVQDFPFTGIGIGTYNQIAHLMYPFFIAAPDEIVPHAHNQFLQVAVDLGIPGLIAYSALLVGFGVCIARAYRASDDVQARALAVGLGCGMFAHHVFGLTDAFILGTKPGIVMWIFLGFAAACLKMTADRRPPTTVDG